MNATTMLAAARNQTDKLFDLVVGDALFERPIPERHRLIFYLGHLEAFDWNLLRPHMPSAGTFHAGFDRLFAFGIDPVGGGLPSDVPADWPREAEIRSYNTEVRRRLDDAEHDDSLLHMALEHRLMHAETLAYLLHQLPVNSKRPERQAAAPAGQVVRNNTADIPAGSVTLGLKRNGEFGWDNEFDAHGTDVAAFAIDRYKVTNGEYLEFVEAGGYGNASWWTQGAFRWIREQNIQHPVFWEQSGDDWVWRGMFEEIPLPLDWPVYVSHAEARAYANWSGGRLPTEAEWHRAAYGGPQGERQYPWGDDSPGRRHGYFEFERWEPSPVSAFPEGRSAFGVDGLLGNGWEWTATPFAPFPGFAAHDSYPGYSADFFDGKHYVLKGGSARTAGCMLRRSFRNWFQPRYQYVYAGFRCVRSA